MEKLKRRWEIRSNWALIVILIVFAINGTLASWMADPITNFIGIDRDNTNPYLYWSLRIILIFPIYQITLPIIGWMFGQFKFFWEFEKSFLTKIGLGFMFKSGKKL